MPTVNLLIKGKTQGVFYRAKAKEKADVLGVTGWIKNIPEGRVEAMVTGSQLQLDAFIDWCKKGTEKSEVSEVIVTPLGDHLYNEFTVIRENDL
ncbi:acylphosphatase [soil metagenome]